MAACWTSILVSVACKNVYCLIRKRYGNVPTCAWPYHSNIFIKVLLINFSWYRLYFWFVGYIYECMFLCKITSNVQSISKILFKEKLLSNSKSVDLNFRNNKTKNFLKICYFLVEHKYLCKVLYMVHSEVVTMLDIFSQHWLYIIINLNYKLMQRKMFIKVNVAREDI